MQAQTNYGASRVQTGRRRMYGLVKTDPDGFHQCWIATILVVMVFLLLLWVGSRGLIPEKRVVHGGKDGRSV